MKLKKTYLMKCKIFKLYLFSNFKIYDQLAVHNSVRFIFHPGGTAVSHLVETLSCKPESHRLLSWWCNWNFSDCAVALGSTQPLTEISTRKFCGVEAAGKQAWQLSFADFLDILEPQPSGTVRTCPGFLLQRRISNSSSICTKLIYQAVILYNYFTPFRWASKARNMQELVAFKI